MPHASAVPRDAPRRIRELIDLGAELDTVDGEIALTKEGGHSHRRVAHALGTEQGWVSVALR